MFEFKPMRALGANIFMSPEQVVQRALQLAGVHQDDLVAVAGPDGLAAMVSLCRAGFERVECAKRATCQVADEACNLLLIVGAMSPEELASTVRRTARLLSDHGALIVQLADGAGQAVVREALAAEGFVASFTLIDRFAGRLVMHRIERPALMRKAG